MTVPACLKPNDVPGVGLAGFFTMGFGCIVGSGWVVLLGAWLARAGPLGAASALVAGAAVMVPVGLVYGELASRFPQAGADYLYMRAAFGRGAGFAVGWYLILFLLLITAFEGVVLAWLMESLWPGLRGVVLYRAVGEPARADALAIGLFGVLCLASLNLRGVAASVRAQEWVTATFLIVACASLLLAGANGLLHPAVPPALPPAHPGIAGWFWVFASSALFYNGFQAVPQLIENRSTHMSLAAVSRVIAGSIAGACAFYVFGIACTSLAAPWQWTTAQPLPAAAAAGYAVPSLGTALLAASIVSVVKTWNAVFVTAVQALVALGRDGLLPRVLAREDRRGRYRYAILLTAAINAVGILLGRGAILPLITMAMLSVGVAIVGCCAAAWRLRRSRGPAPCPAPGGAAVPAAALLGTACMAITALVAPFERGGVPIEFVLMAGWAGIGIVAYRAARRSEGKAACEGRAG